jgi:hypothetical protein
LEAIEAAARDSIQGDIARLYQIIDADFGEDDGAREDAGAAAGDKPS